MNYLSKKDIDGELFSISFIKEMDCHLAQDISGSILNNKKSLLEKASISLEKRPELINLVQLMKKIKLYPH